MSVMTPSLKALVFGSLLALVGLSATAQAQPRLPYGDPEFERDVQRNWSPQAKKQYYLDRRAYYLNRREQIRARNAYQEQLPFQYEQGDGSDYGSGYRARGGYRGYYGNGY